MKSDRSSIGARNGQTIAQLSPILSQLWTGSFSLASFIPTTFVVWSHISLFQKFSSGSLCFHAHPDFSFNPLSCCSNLCFQYATRLERGRVFSISVGNPAAVMCIAVSGSSVVGGRPIFFFLFHPQYIPQMVSPSGTGQLRSHEASVAKGRRHSAPRSASSSRMAFMTPLHRILSTSPRSSHMPSASSSSTFLSASVATRGLT